MNFANFSKKSCLFSQQQILFTALNSSFTIGCFENSDCRKSETHRTQPLTRKCLIMKKTGLIIALTLLINGAFTLFLFENFKADQTAQIEAETAAQLVNYKPDFTNTKPYTLTAPGDFVETSARVTPAVVNITSRVRSGGFPVSGGSGVIISSDGFIVTNNHVVEGGGSLEVTLSDNRRFDAKILGVDPTTDLALIKIKGRNLPTIRYGDSDIVQPGEWVLAVGNPFNLESTVTAGIVSAKGRNINILSGSYSIESFIQTDAVVNPGNSGGALVNTRGELIGINTAIISESGGYEGYSFAVPSNLVKKVIRDLREFGEVQRAILGVNIRTVDASLAENLSLPSVAGIYIDRVHANSSAEGAGLRARDVIVGINGIETGSVPELQEQVARYRPGETITLDLYRNGRKIRKYDVKLQPLSNASTFR